MEGKEGEERKGTEEEGGQWKKEIRKWAHHPMFPRLRNILVPKQDFLDLLG